MTPSEELPLSAPASPPTGSFLIGGNATPVPGRDTSSDSNPEPAKEFIRRIHLLVILNTIEDKAANADDFDLVFAVMELKEQLGLPTAR